jgi:HEAT repeat protein
MTCLSLALLAALYPGQAEAPANPGAPAAMSFKKKADVVTGGIATFLVTSHIVVGPEAVAAHPDCRAVKDFHSEVVRALRSDDRETRKTALEYLNNYAFMLKGSAWDLERDEGVDALGCALGRHALPIRGSLERIVKRAKGEEALLAAVTLLALSPDNPEAVKVVVTEMKVEEPARQQMACKLAGDIRLSQPAVVAALAAALTAKDRAVRLTAARAVWWIGPRAGKTVPELIALLESGKDAWDSVEYFGVMGLPVTDNLALLALSEMGEAARPAIPRIVRLLKGSDEEMQLALLACLGKLGTTAKEAAPAVRKCLDSGSPRVRVRAAVALLCLLPDDEKAVKAVASDLKSKRETVLEDIARLVPKSKALVPLLVEVLKYEFSDGNLKLAAWAVGKMGPIAEAAAPALGRRLCQESKGDLPYTAGEALARIGKSGLPPLVQAVRGGVPIAAGFLGEFRDSKAEIVPVLMEALKDEFLQAGAAWGLGRLRPDDPQVKQALLRIRDGSSADGVAQIMAAWALTQLPQ